MNRMMRSAFPSSQSTVLTDALVRVEISYLDSVTNYHEFLPDRPWRRKRQLRLMKARVAEYSGFGCVVLIAVAMVAILWFFE
jgi:hypothetical protein